MSKKGTIEVFQSKISRNDRFAQMSHQEKLIEQKKREIQAKLEQKKAGVKETEAPSKSTNKTAGSTPSKTSPAKTVCAEKKAFNFNTFSNDGSFLNQFKSQLKEKKLDHKLKVAYSLKQGRDRESDRNNKSKWKKETSTPAITKENRNHKLKSSRFGSSQDVQCTYMEPINLPTMSANFNSLVALSQGFEPMVTAQEVTGQPLLKNLVAQSPTQFSSTSTNVPPILMTVPPPQIQLHPMPPDITVDMCPTTVITTVTLAPPQPPGPEPNTIITVPPPCLELANIPPPNSIQVHAIPQTDPIATLTIIPPPSSMAITESKALDLLSIPTPTEEPDAEFIKNVPPPNKCVPPPSIADNVPTCIPPPNIMPPTSMPPPSAANLNLLVAQVPAQGAAVAQLQLQQLPPPPATLMNPIPALMAQPVLPPATMGIVPPPQINMPPPAIIQQAQIQLPPPGFNQQPPLIPVNVPTNVPPPQIATLKDANAGSADYEAMASLGRMVAQCGPGIEDVVRQRKNQDPSLWFIFDKTSAAYRQYQHMVERFKTELIAAEAECHRSDNDDYKPEEIYESDAMQDDCEDHHTSHPVASAMGNKSNNKRKRKSRWGDKVGMLPTPILQPSIQAPILPSSTSVMLSKITRQDPGFINYVRNTYGSPNLNEETLSKAEDNYKVHLVYQEMLKKKQDLERMQKMGMQKYEYDSDEDVEGGTWEHKQREKEMQSTQQWAHDLTNQADGKHHIGDFLPPEEYQKLVSKLEAAPNSDYVEHKLGEENKGFKMLQKLGWSEGKGLGTTEKGILEPINKGFVSRDGQGLGNQPEGGTGSNEDEYDAYRKRMMLAYKFRPNPLNNPRRAYY